MLEIVIKDLKKSVIDFYTITNIKIVLYDENRNFLYSYPEAICPYCAMVRANPKLAKKCLNCDRIGFDECDKTRKPYIYKCHMNLVEAIAPICENGIIIGYMMIGQILDNSDFNDALNALEKCSKKYKINYQAMKEELMKFCAVNKDFVLSAVNIMSMCACYLYCNKIIKFNTDIIEYQLKNYIASHLRDNLSIKKITEHLYISRTKLYHISIELFDMGISDYIRKCRIDEAKKMLRDSKMPISQIAYEVGIEDTNYFTRVFKSFEKRTPSQYRRMNCNLSQI